MSLSFRNCTRKSWLDDPFWNLLAQTWRVHSALATVHSRGRSSLITWSSGKIWIQV